LNGEMLPGLLALVRAAVDLAEAEVAVGDEGAHPETHGELEGLPIMFLGRPRVEGLDAASSGAPVEVHL
jgi:hypothetical protein